MSIKRRSYGNIVADMHFFSRNTPPSMMFHGRSKDTASKMMRRNGIIDKICALQ